MGHDRATATKAAERSAPRVAPAAPVVAPPSAALQLQRRLGNDGAQRWLARAQRAATVSSPHDAAELEAHAVARRVVRTSDASIAPVDATTAPGASIQRAPLAASAPPAASVSLPANVGGGTPLPGPLRSFMEPRFNASFANVRIHTGEQAAQLSHGLDAQAFTVGPHVFFGKDQYRPDSQAGRELIAHELTHTVQQGAAVQHGPVQRSADVTVAERAGHQVQRSFLGIPNPREYFAGKARAIPGFTMLTVVIGVNPITNARVERSAGNILRGAIELIPGGSLITDALNAHGIFDKISAWAAQQFDALKDIGASLWQDIENFLAGFSATDLLDPGGLWDRAKAIVERPIARIKAFATALKDGIVALIKDAILKPIAEFARTSRGYPLLCAVMGKDPITGEPVAQDAESLLGAFMKFIGEDEIWANMQKANAIPRAFAWFKNAMSALRGFVNEIPGLFMQALHSLQIADIILIPRAFGKLASVFGGFAQRFITWGATAAWNLLEIIFDVVSPGALAYIKKTGAALKSILKNPMPFVGNLVKAAKLGFMNFADHFLEHLKAGLIGWLTGALPGIYIPKAFSLVEIAKFALSVLGLTWANIRAKLVKATSENVVKALEAGAEIVIALVRDGPAAAWEKIKEQLSNLKDMVIGGITDFVVDMVVKKAIPKLISMFIPGAGFISAILSIYDTVMVFVNKIKQIVQVVTGFIDSIVAIAGGAIGAAATKVETSLAGVLALAINFLAGFAGLGKVADKIMGVFEKLRAPFDKAMDWLVNFVVKGATNLLKSVAQAGLPQDPNERLKLGMSAAVGVVNRFAGKKVGAIVLQPLLEAVKVRYGFKTLAVVAQAKTWAVTGEINPKATTPTQASVGSDTETGAKPSEVPALVAGVTTIVLIGVQEGTKRGWPAKVTEVSGDYLKYEGPGGKRHTFNRGQLALAGYLKTWRLVESPADSKVQVHHKIPWENARHVTHPLTVLSKVDLKTDARNLMSLGGHAGNHSAEYHEDVSISLTSAYATLAAKTQPEAHAAIGKVMANIEDRIAAGTLKPYKDRDVWIP